MFVEVQSWVFAAKNTWPYVSECKEHIKSYQMREISKKANKTIKQMKDQ